MKFLTPSQIRQQYEDDRAAIAEGMMTAGDVGTILVDTVPSDTNESRTTEVILHTFRETKESFGMVERGRALC
jgi:hypothetical protein